MRTEGRFVVDASGARFKLAGASWYGGESATLVPDGLDRASLGSIARAGARDGLQLGALALVQRNGRDEPRRRRRADVSANPDLDGKTVLEVLDAVIEALARRGPRGDARQPPQPRRLVLRHRAR